MSTIRTIAWQLPAVGPGQVTIDHVQVDFRVKPSAGDPQFTPLDTVAASSAQKLDLTDPPPGIFQYRLTAVDANKQPDPNPPIVENSAKAPGSVTAITVTDTTA